MLKRFVPVTSLAVLVTAAVVPAAASDLDEIIYAPDITLTKPVEMGTGWYLRGDLGYSAETRGAATHYNVFDSTVPQYLTEAYDSSSLSKDWSAGLGLGYAFTDFFRGDLTADFSEGRFSGSTTSTSPCPGAPSGECSSVHEQDYSQFNLMANVYLDLGTVARFTPYVGAGAGMSKVAWREMTNNPLCINAPGNACGATPPGSVAHPEEDSWRFTYALMAGVSYNISDDLKLDVGYRYSKTESGPQYGYDTTSAGAGAVGASAHDNGFERHEIRAGLRYALW